MGDWWQDRFAGQVAFGTEKLSTIKKGSRGPTVSRWQSILGLKQDGNFGSGTDAATKTWQGAHGLKADGVVGPATWQVALQTPDSPVQTIASQVERPPTTAAVAVAHPTIRQGSTGVAVTDWQNVLGIKPADGNFGPKTRLSTVNFQKRAKLKADGVVGPATWMAAYASHAADGGPTPPLQVIDSTNELPSAPQPPASVAASIAAAAPVIRPPNPSAGIVAAAKKKKDETPWWLAWLAVIGIGGGIAYKTVRPSSKVQYP